VAESSFTMPPEVIDTWRSGNKIEAIRLLRQATNIGLAEAKAALEALDHLGGATVDHAAAASLPNVLQALQASGELPAEVMAAWQRGDRIGAMKGLAEAVKAGRVNVNSLTEAAGLKIAQTVEVRTQAQAPGAPLQAPSPAASASTDGLAPGQVPSSKLGPGAIIGVVLVLAALAVALYFVF
jgi:ribosomal protein L7/L12